MADFRPPKLRWILVAILLYWGWRALPRSAEEPEAPVPPPPVEASLPTPRLLLPAPAEPGRRKRHMKKFKPKPLVIHLSPTPSPRPTPRPLPTPKRKRAAKSHPTLTPTWVPAPSAPAPRLPGATPTKVPVLGAMASEPEMVLPTNVPTPKPKSLFEMLAFQSTKQVRAMLGDPDAKLVHDDQDGQTAVESWYYLQSDENTQGGRDCPELRFVDGKVRFVVFWTPSAMQSLIDDAKSSAGGHKSRPVQDFSFKDGFRYLGVGTPEDTLLEDLGEPDAKRMDQGREAWDYNTLLVEDGAAKRMTVFIKDGKVVEVRNRQ